MLFGCSQLKLKQTLPGRFHGPAEGDEPGNVFILEALPDTTQHRLRFLICRNGMMEWSGTHAELDHLNQAALTSKKVSKPR